MVSSEIRPALLTRSEIDYLMSKTKPKPNLAKVMKHNILSKVKNFVDLKLPLLEEASKSWPNLEKIVNICINQVNAGVNLRAGATNSPKPMIHELVWHAGFEGHF